MMSPFLPKDLFINFLISSQEGFSIIHIFLTSLRIFLLFGISVENWFAYWNGMDSLSNNLFSAFLHFFKNWFLFCLFFKLT